nr:immunoglobulin light chain junction region [Macaca mulatta]MOX21341.1 immunoglobulin light chain junction region [Macaca mulatta]MOX21360.1 immunoglobulin light chain junction region [Macaca mulatta]MOX21570.1 immunoglobulin light chain junction region [Macaca mulatta]
DYYSTLYMDSDISLF